MSRGDRKPPRTVTSDEAELWDQLTRTVDKVRAKPRVRSGEEPPAPPPPAPPAPAPKARPKGKTERSPPPPAPAPAPRAPPPLADFDRRTLRQVASGRIGIDARIDLHGFKLEDARARLRAFLFSSQAKGARMVLVITGKGGGPGAPRDNLASALGMPQRGVLRRSVPQWLEEPDMRAVVLSYDTASIRHGGEGALYVHLRKRAGHGRP